MTMREVQEEFRGAVEQAERMLTGYLGERLLAAYLGGSIAFGEAWPGASDFDGYTVIAQAPTEADQAWTVRAEAHLQETFPVVSGFHLRLNSLAQLEGEPFTRFILGHNAVCYRGRDVLPGLAARGYAVPRPDAAHARSRLAFVVECVEAACGGGCPASLGERLEDPMLWSRKLARNFMVVEGAHLLMTAGCFRSFRQGEVLERLERTFPQWAGLYAMTRAVLKDPYAAGVRPERFMAEAQPFLHWMVGVIRGSG